VAHPQDQRARHVAQIMARRQADARLHAPASGLGQDRRLVEDRQHDRVRRLHRHANRQVRRAMTRRLAPLLVLSAIAAPALSHAQAACKWSASDEWVKRQAEFFDESKHDWTNDSLRTALLSAAGLTAPLKSPVNLGVQMEGRDATLGANADEM